MGRIKTKQIKRITKQLLREHSAEFTANFDSNKESLAKIAVVKSKKIRNVLAGSLSRQVKLKRDVQNYAE